MTKGMSGLQALGIICSERMIQSCIISIVVKPFQFILDADLK